MDTIFRHSAILLKVLLVVFVVNASASYGDCCDDMELSQVQSEMPCDNVDRANVRTVYLDGKGSAWFTLWDITAVDSDRGQRVLTGPVAVYFMRNIAARLENKLEAYDDDDGWDGNYISFTLGMVY